MRDRKLSIPFLNLQKINKPYYQELKDHFATFLDSGNYINGKALLMFEKEFADFCGVSYCIGVGNGLDALTLLLKSYIHLGKIHIGDEVLVAANTFIATILSVKQAGLSPVLIEPDEHTYVMDVTKIENKISEKTKVILPTHLYGQLAAMETIAEIAKKRDLLVISDAAQAHGAKDSKGNDTGSLGDANAFSFYPTKNLGAFGDGGAVTTNDPDVYKVIKSLRNYGFSKKYINEYLGVNSRLDEIQASFLSLKLKNLKSDNQKRREIAQCYLDQIHNKKIILPTWSGLEDHVFHLFVIRVQDRDEFCHYLDTQGIGYLIHYPVAPHQQKPIQEEYAGVELPITEKLHNEVVSIPLHIALEDIEIQYIIKILNQY